MAYTPDIVKRPHLWTGGGAGLGDDEYAAQGDQIFERIANLIAMPQEVAVLDEDPVIDGIGHDAYRRLRDLFDNRYIETDYQLHDVVGWVGYGTYSGRPCIRFGGDPMCGYWSIWLPIDAAQDLITEASREG